MGKAFDEYAAEYDSWFLANPNVLASEVRLVAAMLKGCRSVLSVGCGSGLFEKILADDYGLRITHGIEPSAGMAAIARKRGMTVTESTAEEADYGDGEFDAILFNGSPSYITDLRGVVKKVYESLAPGGKIILIDVPKESSYGLLYNLAKAVGTWNHQLLEGTFPPAPYPIEFVNVANWRTTAEKIETLTEAGFRNLEAKQTLTRHPLYSETDSEEPTDGFDRGDYVAVAGYKL
ncbi:MAG: class I SAM-dependent methyltransferase [Duncaniella sp.]|nr:class I SAM-dependent methyltransferase [Duncaniella sp.]